MGIPVELQWYSLEFQWYNTVLNFTFSYFSTKTYVVRNQKNFVRIGSFEHLKRIFRLKKTKQFYTQKVCMHKSYQIYLIV